MDALRNHKYSLLLLVFCIVMLVWKFPSLFSHPRFWAEEGVVVFGVAHSKGVLDLLQYNIGYFSFVPLMAAALFPVTDIYHAPYVTLAVSLLCQLLVVSIVCFGNSPFWDTYFKKTVVAASIVLMAQAEIWLTTIASQYWLCLGVFLILFEEVAGAGPLRRSFYRVMLLFGGLNGIMSSFFFPLFLFRAYRSRGREQTIQASILGFCALAQSGLLLLSYMAENSHLALRGGRQAMPAIHYFHKQFIWPFLGYPTDRMYENFFERISGYLVIDDFIARTFVIAVPIVVIVMALLLLWDIRRSPHALMAYASFALIFALTCRFAVLMKLSGRYVFVTTVIILVILLDRACNSRNLFLKGLSALLLVVSIGLNLRQFSTEDFLRTVAPDWRQEVALWENDCSYRPKVWPYNAERAQWEVDLPCGKKP